MLNTEGLVLRQWHTNDAPNLFEHASDERVGAVAGWPKHVSGEHSRLAIESFFSGPEIYAVRLKEDNIFIGMVDLLIGKENNLKLLKTRLEVVYWTGAPFGILGITPETAKKLMRHAYENLGIRDLWCGYFANNEKPFKAQEKSGLLHHCTEENKFR